MTTKLLDWFDSSRFMPHGMCLDWNPAIVGLSAGSDIVIAISYYSIPVALLYFVRKRQESIFQLLLILFSFFIIACGTTHLLDVWTLWKPDYAVAACAKAVTAAASLATAIVLWDVMPQAIAIPSPRDLRTANDLLTLEIRAHDNARLAAIQLAADFEARVMQRTAELEQRTAELAEESERRRRAIDQQRNSAAALATVIGASPIGKVVIDLAGTVTIWNRAAERIYGVAGSAAVGQPYPACMDNFVWPAGGSCRALAAEVAATGWPETVELSRREANGRYKVLVFYATPLLTAEDEPAGTLFTVDDVSDRRHLEAQLRQSQKMEAIGQLTGGVAHDFNNLLAIILGNVELLNELIQGAPDQRMMFQEVIAAAMRGAKLTQHLLAYSRQQPLEPRSVDVRQLVIDLVGLLRRTIGERITIHLSLPDELGHARIDPSQLENALLNLALNARDAMPDTGQLAIEAENIVIEPVAADELAEIVPGAYVQLAVTDTGVGMSNDIRDRALEPFFTTKPVGEGSGLGLSMVYGFVKQSGGHLKIYSELGHGTSVRLYLPRQYLPADVQETQALPLPQGGGELILVVEDDAAVRRLAVRMLTGFGYRTCEAADAAAALTLLEASPPIQLLLTDVMLPHGMTGATLAAEVKQQRPGTKVMFMSGYTKNVILHRGSLDSGLHFIAKPFPKAELARKIRAALDEG